MPCASTMSRARATPRPRSQQLHAGQRLRITLAYDPTTEAVCSTTDRDTHTTAAAQLPLQSVAEGHFGFTDERLPVHVEYVAVYAPVP